MTKGTEMHKTYSFPYKTLDRTILRGILINNYPRIFIKNLFVSDTLYQIRGMYDDLVVNFDPVSKTKTVSLIEIKTTTKNRPYTWEVDSAEFQLQIYIWLYKDAITEIGHKYDQTHYVEFYNQASSNLIKRIPIQEHPNIVEYLTYVIETFQGVAPFTYPPLYYCRTCPKSIKEHCDRK